LSPTHSRDSPFASLSVSVSGSNANSFPGRISKQFVHSSLAIHPSTSAEATQIRFQEQFRVIHSSTSVPPSTMPSEHPPSAPSSNPPHACKLLLHADCYPGETTWTITDDCKNNEMVAAGGPHASKGADIINYLLEEGKHTLTVSDSCGDGLCCSYGNGAFSVIRQDGTLTASVGTFISSTASASFGSNSCSTPFPSTMPSTMPSIVPGS
jgi:hypothetical protein